MKNFKHPISFLAFFLVINLTTIPGLCNGGKGKRTVYTGLDYEHNIELICELEKTSFKLNSVQNKYKVIQLKITNKNNKNLILSKDKDKMEIYFNDAIINGILNLPKHDPKLWDSFAPDLRKTLVYPKLVEKFEEENIFVFISNPKVNELPLFFQYTIDSLERKRIKIHEYTPVYLH